jgi:uncharacterized protein involved in outer membrane biogenesis
VGHRADQAARLVLANPTGPQRWLLIAVAAVVILVGMVLMVEHHATGLVLRAVESRSGRQLRIAGPFEVHLLSLRPTIKAQGVSVSNPPWMPPGTMAEIKSLSATMAWQFSWPPFSVTRLQLADAHLHLAREASGRANWYLQPSGPGRGPPLIRSLSMSDVRVELHDERLHLEFHGKVHAGDVDDGTAAPALRITGAGELNGRLASFVIDGEPLAHAQRSAPYHFRIVEQSGNDRLDGRGFLKQAFDFRELQGTFALSGPDLEDVYYLVGLKLPQTGPYHVAGQLLRHDERFEYPGLAIATGQSDVSGTLSEDSSSGRASIKGVLRSGTLRLADLGFHAGTEATQAQQSQAQTVLDQPLQLSGLQHSDWNLRLHVSRLELGPEALQDVSAHLSVNKAVLSLEEITLALADGTVRGSARLEAERSPAARAALNLNLAQLQTAELANYTNRPALISGPLSARIQLEGEGASLHELLASAHGTVSAVIPNGSMRAAVAEAASLDLAGALGIATKNEKQTRVRCGIASFSANQGVLTARTLLLDTDKALITGTGEIHMDSEALALSLRGKPKHPGLTLHSSVTVRGTLAHPEVHLDSGKMVAQGAAAAALGIALTPAAAVLAFINPGLAHNADCAALTAAAEVPGGPN